MHPCALSTRGGEASRFVIAAVEFSLPRSTVPLGMRATFCAIYYRPTCGFFLYYTAPIPGIGTIPATPGHQGHGCCWDSVARGGVFNRNSILSRGVIGAFCRISWHDARSSVVTNDARSMLVVLCCFMMLFPLDWIG